ncbi:MAG: right-handed parallel beta-helix repeat-containing protein [Propionibacteriaceae bacterium]|nr:right-handed parallel beta-helix repeat-containing protein [Propionibacteriaceae bacterium]
MKSSRLVPTALVPLLLPLTGALLWPQAAEAAPMSQEVPQVSTSDSALPSFETFHNGAGTGHDSTGHTAVSAVQAPAAPGTTTEPATTGLEAALEVEPSGSDDTASLQQAINDAAAQGIGVRLKARAQYVTTEELLLPDGLTTFDGQGASIIAKLPARADGHAGNVFRFATHSSGTTLTNVGIDLSDSAQQTRGVLAATVTNITISKLNIQGIQFRGIDVVANQGPVTGIRINGNTVKGPLGTKEASGTQGISVTSHAAPDRFSGTRSAAYDRFRETGEIASPVHEASDVHIVNNTIDGNYYGIALSGATDCQITGNSSTNNVRNLSMQDKSTNNHVRDNDFTESESSAIHLAYGASSNIVEENRIRTGRAHGQGLLQAYQGSIDNTFRGNRVEVYGEGHPSWFLYVATSSHNTTFEGNTLIGKANNAVAAAESIWDHRSAISEGLNPNPYSYSGERTKHPGYDDRLVDFAGGHEDLKNISFINNTFNTQGQPFYLGADVTYGPSDDNPAVGNLTGVRISGNQLEGSGYPNPIVEHRGSLANVGKADISFTEKQ